MKKKLFSLPLILLLTVGCFACQNAEEVIPTKTVTFYNYDGAVLYTTEYVLNSGEPLEYKGETPKRPSSKEYDYVFSSWDHGLEEVELYSTYHALYEETPREYQIEFLNYDTSSFYKTTAHYGENVYEQEIPSPSKPSTSQRQQFVFTSWDNNELSYVTKDLTVKPVFEIHTFYQVTYLNADGSVIETIFVQEGTDAPTSLVPTQDIDDDTKIYVFNHWEGNYKNIKEDTTLTAVYDEKRAYIVTFYRYDNTIYKKVKVESGGSLSVPGISRPNTASTYYVFERWSVSLTYITSNLSAYPVYKSYTATEYLMLYLQNNTYDTLLNSWQTLTIYPDSWDTGHVKFGYSPGDNSSLIVWAVFSDSYGYSYEMTYIFTSQSLSNGTGAITYDANRHTYFNQNAAFNQYYDAGLIFKATASYHSVSTLTASSYDCSPYIDATSVGTQMRSIVIDALNSVNTYLYRNDLPYAF